MHREIICIVEGQGDELAVPILVRRIAFLLDESLTIRCRVWRKSKSALLKAECLERDVEFASRLYPRARGVLLLIDADRDCPALLGRELLRRASQARSDLRIGVALAKCEYEAWFIASLRSLQSHADVVSKPADERAAEEVLGAKEWLAKHMRSGKYVETRHQPAFSQLMDFKQAETSRSFRKLMKEVGELLR